MSPDVYILKDGLPVFTRSAGEKTLENVNMTAGFFQAILEFSKMQVGENLEAISLSDSLFYFSTKEGFTFILRVEKTSPQTRKEITLILSLLSQRFFEKYPSAMKWDGNLAFFEGFTPICAEILQTQAISPDMSISPDVFPEQPLIPISTVIVAEASKKLCALIDNGNANLNAKKYRKAKEDYDSAIGLLTMLPELVPHYPDLKPHLLDQMKLIETLMQQEKASRDSKSPSKADQVSGGKQAHLVSEEGGVLVDFHGAKVFQPEADVLLTLEQQLGKSLQQVVQVVWDSLGFTAEGGHVRQIGLYKQGLTALPPILRGFPALEILFVDDNRMTTYPVVLENLPYLGTLSLASNRLTSLPESIGNLQSLRILHLGWNKLTNLPQNLPKNLEILDLRYNQLTNLPDAIGNLINLQQLALDYNQVAQFPQTIGKLQSLQKLTVNNNLLTTLPPSFCILQKLEKLEINANKLESLPESFGGLGSLQVLDLGYNLLPELPASFGNLGVMHTLTIIHNRLNYLPDSFGSLHSLRDLCLSFNKLISLPHAMGTLNSLESLDLRGTPLETLPSCLTQLSSLQNLFLGWDLLRDPIATQLSKTGVKVSE